MGYLQLTCLVFLTGFIYACGGGNSASKTPPLDTPKTSSEPTAAPPPIKGGVLVSGHLSFDKVPHNTDGSLDYSASFRAPIRGATVQLLSNAGELLAQISSDDEGNYAMRIGENTTVRVRVRAELQKADGPSWWLTVSDNTQDNALYVLDGNVTNSGERDSVRDLHADSGWDGEAYSRARVAAPFAILDAVYQALQLVVEADPDVNIENTQLRWSKHNVAVPGNLEAGEISTSSYNPNDNNIYILGDADNDSDEYDQAVIQHEFAHFIEGTLSRSDSPGGVHTLTGAHDMRLAFSEGLANAFAGYAGGEGIYADSSGQGQSMGFSFSLENNAVGNAGWFSENSIGKIVYDIADNDQDGVDTLSLGIAPVYEALTSPRYINNTAFTSIYTFVDAFKSQNSSATNAVLDALLDSESIYGSDSWGENESNTSVSNISSALPVYKDLTQGGIVNVCGNNREYEFNGLGVRRFIKIDVVDAGNYTIALTKTLGTGARDPDARLWLRGTVIAQLVADGKNNESLSVNLSEEGVYVLEVYDFLNADFLEGGGSSCFDVSFNLN
ncbi:MAG: hypothetical protein ACI9Y1_001048 [Lentisphaeria bacterium]|jgi:hypothetical protein